MGNSSKSFKKSEKLLPSFKDNHKLTDSQEFQIPQMKILSFGHDL